MTISVIIRENVNAEYKLICGPSSELPCQVKAVLLRGHNICLKKK